MQSFDYISEKLGVSPTLDPFLGMCRTLRADLRTVSSYPKEQSPPLRRKWCAWDEDRCKICIGLA